MRVRYYSWLADEIATRFGDDRLDAIALAAGGMSLDVPRALTPHLIALFGRDVAEWLIEARGGERVQVISRSNLEARRERIRRNKRIAASSLSGREIAKAYGLSERQVARIRNNTYWH